jgi:hypothetical protein
MPGAETGMTAGRDGLAAMRARLGPFGIALDNPDVETLAGQVTGRRKADNTSTADDHTARVTHEIEVSRERFKPSILIKALASPPKI